MNPPEFNEEISNTMSGDSQSRSAGESLKIRTPRLELIAATPQLVRAELADLDLFSKMLDARVPASWPPELYDRQAAEWTLTYLESEPERAGWALWYCILPGDASPGRVLAGIAGYKGTPSSEGRVEIGYGVLSEFQRAGYAT
ncbi:MAG: GNAT family N-acetyltransferase, partial [Blastocatellia bacterium]